mmetsp:Transcript_4763/g.14714  ORF Transcript_4763/g.14714 Transcript_4763/m.14714 type:complete len:239 (-) Transcript_4763:21-737(-)
MLFTHVKSSSTCSCAAEPHSDSNLLYASCRSSLPMYSSVNATVSSERKECAQDAGGDCSRTLPTMRSMSANNDSDAPRSFLYCRSWPALPSSLMQSRNWAKRNASGSCLKSGPRMASTNWPRSLPEMRLERHCSPTSHATSRTGASASPRCRLMSFNTACSSVRNITGEPPCSQPLLVSASAWPLRRKSWNGGLKKLKWLNSSSTSAACNASPPMLLRTSSFTAPRRELPAGASLSKL